MKVLLIRLLIYAMIIAVFLISGLVHGFNEIKWMGLVFLIIFVGAEFFTWLSIKRRMK